MTQTFVFDAVGRDGTIDHGAVTAASAGEARDSIASRGLLVLSIEARGPQGGRRPSLSARDLALGLRVLGDLLESGLSARRAAHAFEERAPRGWRDALPQIRQSIREGRTLASALATAPIEIPGLVIGIAQAGGGGTGVRASAPRCAAPRICPRPRPTCAPRSAARSPIRWSSPWPAFRRSPFSSPSSCRASRESLATSASA